MYSQTRGFRAFVTTLLVLAATLSIPARADDVPN